MFRTVIRGVLAAVALALPLSGATIALSTTSALASTCDPIYGSNPGDNMPTDPGKTPMPSTCPTSTPKPPAPKPPAPKPPAPKPPAPKPPVHHNPTPSHRPPAHRPVVKSTPPKKVVRHAAPPHKVVRHAVPPKKVVKPAKKVVKAMPQSITEPACAMPVVQTSFKFPWLLAAIAGALIAGLFTSIGARVFLATGHRWPAVLRRAVAGPDHARID